jgi:hypothetical protein
MEDWILSRYTDEELVAINDEIHDKLSKVLGEACKSSHGHTIEEVTGKIAGKFEAGAHEVMKEYGYTYEVINDGFAIGVQYSVPGNPLRKQGVSFVFSPELYKARKEGESHR